jgi:hypothetical protein
LRQRSPAFRARAADLSARSGSFSSASPDKRGIQLVSAPDAVIGMLGGPVFQNMTRMADVPIDRAVRSLLEHRYVLYSSAPFPFDEANVLSCTRNVLRTIPASVPLPC